MLGANSFSRVLCYFSCMHLMFSRLSLSLCVSADPIATVLASDSVTGIGEQQLVCPCSMLPFLNVSLSLSSCVMIDWILMSINWRSMTKYVCFASLCGVNDEVFLLRVVMFTCVC